MLHYYAIIILVILAAISKAVMDKLQFHFEKSRWWNKGKWWNPAQSWELKWKNGDINQGERFWLSSTVLAWATDAWHFFQMLFLSSLQLAIAIGLTREVVATTIWFLALKALFSLVFEVAFSKVFTKR